MSYRDAVAYQFGSDEILRQINADCIPSQTGTANCACCNDEFAVYEHEHDVNAQGEPLCPSCAWHAEVPA